MTKKKRAHPPEPPPIEHMEETPVGEPEWVEFTAVVDVNGVRVTVSAPSHLEEVVRLEMSEPGPVRLKLRQARAVRDAIDAALRVVAGDRPRAIHVDVDCPHPHRDPDEF